VEPARFGLSTLTLPAKVGSELNRESLRALQFRLPPLAAGSRPPADPDGRTAPSIM